MLHISRRIFHGLFSHTFILTDVRTYVCDYIVVLVLRSTRDSGRQTDLLRSWVSERGKKLQTQ